MFYLFLYLDLALFQQALYLNAAVISYYITSNENTKMVSNYDAVFCVATFDKINQSINQCTFKDEKRAKLN